jgi:4-nitrophenyl phosphatase
MNSIYPAATHTAGLILDMDGTLMQGIQPLPGLAQLFNHLHQNDIPFIIATNNAQHSAQDYQDKLSRCGVAVSEKHILTSAMATASTLQNQLPQGAPVYVIGRPALTSTLQTAGFEILTDASTPAAAVIVGGDPFLTYDKLKYATLLIQRGARFVGTNPDLVYPTEQGLVPECGTTLAALQAATDVRPLVIGKPEPILFNLAAQHLGTAPERTYVVGDRLETDILGGLNAGFKTILVTTGVDQASSISKKAIHPDHIVPNLVELTVLLTKLI